MILTKTDVSGTEEQDDKIDKLLKSKKQEENASADFCLFNDAADWPIPVPDHIRSLIIKKGSEVF